MRIASFSDISVYRKELTISSIVSNATTPSFQKNDYTILRGRKISAIHVIINYKSHSQQYIAE
ncbi:hypothetical protein KDK_01600 [Dictyobacter kobayashii]|uniref:Uncharacterized protein n=1 Tax=Dictyobacter kobayashii TaxID=2014872 RepID=A0A402AB59_9CHLR|nr:hypothetical protein KDK_01600 [Dictyobacter kobayashii]